LVGADLGLVLSSVVVVRSQSPTRSPAGGAPRADHQRAELRPPRRHPIPPPSRSRGREGPWAPASPPIARPDPATRWSRASASTCSGDRREPARWVRSTASF